MGFHRRIDGDIDILSTEARHCQALEELQDIVFPQLDLSERLRAEHYRHHLELFPEGQFVASEGDRVVGMTSTIRLAQEVAFGDHTFAEIIRGGTLDSHDPKGDWLYGVDVGTHPDMRGRGIARALYAARQDLVHRLGLKGQITVGMLNGFREHSHELDLESYYEAVATGRLRDPTVSAQMHLGFEARGLVENYVSDPTCGNAGARLVLVAEKIIDAPWQGATP